MIRYFSALNEELHRRREIACAFECAETADFHKASRGNAIAIDPIGASTRHPKTNTRNNETTPIASLGHRSRPVAIMGSSPPAGTLLHSLHPPRGPLPWDSRGCSAWSPPAVLLVADPRAGRAEWRSAPGAGRSSPAPATSPRPAGPEFHVLSPIHNPRGCS